MLNLRDRYNLSQFQCLSVYWIDYLNTTESSGHLIEMMSYQHRCYSSISFFFKVSVKLHFVFCFKTNGKNDKLCDWNNKVNTICNLLKLPRAAAHYCSYWTWLKENLGHITWLHVNDNRIRRPCNNMVHSFLLIIFVRGFFFLKFL